MYKTVVVCVCGLCLLREVHPSEQTPSLCSTNSEFAQRRAPHWANTNHKHKHQRFYIFIHLQSLYFPRNNLPVLMMTMVLFPFFAWSKQFNNSNNQTKKNLLLQIMLWSATMWNWRGNHKQHLKQHHKQQQKNNGWYGIRSKGVLQPSSITLQT